MTSKIVGKCRAGRVAQQAHALARRGQSLLLALLLSSCALFRPGGPDLAALADEVALYRQDVQALAPLASPALQLRIAELSASIVKVEDALRVAGAGGPLTDAVSYAKAALAIADAIALELAPDSDVRFAIALARVVLNHIAAGQVGQAADEDAVHAEAAQS